MSRARSHRCASGCPHEREAEKRCAAPRSKRRSATLSWEAKSAALEKAFRDLPIWRGTATGIPYEILIPDIPRQLMLMLPNSPNSRPKAAGTKKGLQRLARSTRSTIKALDGLSQTALDSLNYKPAALRKLTTNLRILHAAAEMAAKKKAEVKGRAGRPEQVQPSQAKKIARVVAQHYRGLTGKKPTASGPFVKLLHDVYEILGIEASARSQAEALPPE